MIRRPDITDRQIINEMTAGTFSYNGIKYGSTHAEVMNELGSGEHDLSYDYPEAFGCEYGTTEQPVTFSFVGKKEWHRDDFFILSIDYNHLESLNYDRTTIQKLWGPPHQTSTEKPDWDDDGEFTTYHDDYGYAHFHFNEDKKLFAVSYYDDNVQKEWADD